ncbi:unnamed protein product [Heligmosomoides polygyrus]|uniref:Uncharacterized protein n=1 Tax=Heligmosomoides polygyrus TaxID=6339 RepID=A0A183FAH1_HELPZ|nr:unnamed protein product [Heligmosomoides polygyrus]
MAFTYQNPLVSQGPLKDLKAGKDDELTAENVSSKSLSLAQGKLGSAGDRVRSPAKRNSFESKYPRYGFILVAVCLAN